MRWISTIAAAAVLLVGVCGLAQAARAVRIATEGAYPPFNYVDQANEPAGFEVDLARALCLVMDATCTFTVQDWDGMIDALKAGRFDAIVSSMEITPDRQRRIAFSKRYYSVPAALIGVKSAEPGVTSPSGLAGKIIGTTADSEFLTFLEANYKDSTIKTYDKADEAFLDLVTGRLDFVLGDKLALFRLLGDYEATGCCKFIADLPVDRGDGIGVGLRKADKDLVASFNSAIDRVMADGTYDRIRAKYFAFDIK